MSNPNADKEKMKILPIGATCKIAPIKANMKDADDLESVQRLYAISHNFITVQLL